MGDQQERNGARQAAAWRRCGRRSRRWALLLLLGCTACHEAQRSNPMDPALTAPVSLVRVEMNAASGSVTLEWTPYAGQQPFAAYRLVRKVRGLEEERTVAVIDQPAVTRFTDGDSLRPDLDYLYRVVVVNRAGYESASAQVSAGSFTVQGSRLATVAADVDSGQVVLRWVPYQGPGFLAYTVWRRRFGQVAMPLARLDQIEQAAYRDTTALPEVEYTYWIGTAVTGKTEELDSEPRDVSYALPAVEWVRADVSSLTAGADLAWTRYRGPRFAGYAVLRRVPGGVEDTVRVLPGINDTSLVDRPLDGNTEYTYRVAVRTTWGRGVEVVGDRRAGGFYRWTRTLRLPVVTSGRVQSVGLAVDEADQVWVAASHIATTTSRAMLGGVRFTSLGAPTYRTTVGSTKPPSRLSPLPVVAAGGRGWVAFVTDNDDSLHCAAFDLAAGGSLLWQRAVPAQGSLPVGIYRRSDGGVGVVDQQGLIVPFAADGTVKPPELGLQASLSGTLPLQAAVLAPAGAGLGGLPQFYLLVPAGEGHRVIGRVVVSPALYGGGATLAFDDGVGADNGQALTPLALTYDAVRARVLFLEAGGRLQTVDGRPDPPGMVSTTRHITKWGRFGSGDGEFLLSPPTAAALVVDSAGRVYVADGAGRVQVFEP